MLPLQLGLEEEEEKLFQPRPHFFFFFLPQLNFTTKKNSSGGFANTSGYDSEGKSLSIKRAFWGKATAHTLAFHLAWFGFMVAIWSSFAPAAVITSITKDLNLTKGQIADSNVAAVLGGVVAHLFVGKFMDTFGPRYALLLCLWGTAPVVFAMSAVRNFTEYALCRFFMAWALAAVIPCIQWTMHMYNGEFCFGWGWKDRERKREKEKKEEEREKSNFFLFTLKTKKLSLQ